jgi:rhodanese-related sulfurtransferase
MAPFIPEGIINPELNLFFALVIGLGFGFVLEQAGFSSSRKLAGVFYGYDFVVLKVFFTAGVTAMVGLVFLGFMGWIDMSLIYINPTYLYSAVVGGLIMGAGFIMGGYCPGTSIVAATVGKIDAMLFLVGAMAGIFIFGHYYHAWEPLYNGQYLGSPFIYETLGISKAWFAFLLTLVAVVAFAVTQKIEDNINKTSVEIIKQRPSYLMPGALLLLATFFFLFLPSQRRSNAQEVPARELLVMLQQDDKYVDVEEVLYKIMHRDKTFVLIDTRPEEEYEQFALPGAVRISPQDITGKAYRAFLNDPRQKKVFYSNGESTSALAWAIAARAGFQNVYILQGGLNHLFDVLSQEQPFDPVDMEEEFSGRFLTKARDYFINGPSTGHNSGAELPMVRKVETVVKKSAGGC